LIAPIRKDRGFLIWARQKSAGLGLSRAAGLFSVILLDGSAVDAA